MELEHRAVNRCSSCQGSGELGSEVGPVACPDCGGGGVLPSTSTLLEWRARDIERAYEGDATQVSADVRWLVAELRRARAALTEVVALAQDLEDSTLATRLRFVAGTALGLYEVTPAERSVHAPHDA